MLGCARGARKGEMRRAAAAWMAQSAMDVGRKAATVAVAAGVAMTLAVAAEAMAGAVEVTTTLAVDIGADRRRLPLNRGAHPPLLLLLLHLLLVPRLPFARVGRTRLRLRAHRKAVVGCQMAARAAVVSSPG